MTAPADALVRSRIRVRGVVQGVGFRPFVHATATELGLAGHVANDAEGVLIEAEGDPRAVGRLLATLRERAPRLAVVQSVEEARIPPTGERAFRIVASDAGSPASTWISPDTATCDDCLRELADPADRRYRYPFTNCTNCGPRFSIVTTIPYDRPNTTMATFRMCAACEREYHDPADRRFHAQPTCCPACGPRLSLLRDGRECPGDPVEAAAALLVAGAVVAVKGLGGYHLAVDAANEPAVARLRARKHREEKPFAVLCPDLAAAGSLAELDGAERELLTSRRAPIVLVRRRADAPVAASVAPGNAFLGLLLPYTPAHHLLCAAVGRPLVLTSGNVSDEPIAYDDTYALEHLAGIADAFLVSDRPINIRTDDSVTRIVRGRELPIRRSRGYAPEPLPVPWPTRRPVLGCGAELKSTFSLLRGRHAVVSHHIGDLANYETLRSFTQAIAHYQRLFEVTPEVVAYDLHPDYLSSKYALDLDGVRLVGVQHHHAHVASCLADNGEAGPVIGVAFDGTGFGSDSTLWGGEILVADLAGFERVGHLAPVRLPGGEAAVREPWRMAAVYFDAAGGDLPGLAVRRRHAQRWEQVLSLARSGTAAPLTTSAGRLFDAVAALVGVRDEVSYEGQAAIELEQRVDATTPGAYAARVSDGDEALVIHGSDLFRAAALDCTRGVSAGVVAARFHRGLAAAVSEAVERVAVVRGLRTVALSGGVFQNLVLTAELTGRLTGRGLRVLTHHRVPPNDAGVSLGQAAVAAELDRAG